MNTSHLPRRPACRYCQRTLSLPKTGRAPQTCKRKPCQQAAARERQRRHRAKVAV